MRCLLKGDFTHLIDLTAVIAFSLILITVAKQTLQFNLDTARVW